MMPAIPPKTGADFNGGLILLALALAYHSAMDVRDKVPIPFCLLHEEANLFIILQLNSAKSKQGSTDLQCAVDLAFLQQISPAHSIFSLLLARPDILGQVQFEPAKRDILGLVTSQDVMEDLKTDVGFLKHASLVYGQSNRHVRLIVVLDPVLLDATLVCSPSIFRSVGMRKMPFYMRFAGDIGDVAQVNDLKIQVKFELRRSGQ